MKKSILLLATIAVLAPCLTVATNAATQVYDLKADWSDTQNPNGAWSYREGNNLLHSVLLNGFDPAWVGLDGFAPRIYYEAGYGDVTVFPGFPAFGEGIANILWTAPSTGTIDISGAVGNIIGRCGDGSSFWALSHNGNSLSGGQFTCGDVYDPLNFSLGSGGSGVLQNVPVTAGDQVVLEIGHGSSGAGISDITVNFTITFTEGSVDPVTAIEDLATMVVQMNLQNGIENSLDSKLDAAINALIDANFNNDGAACNSLAAFISAVEAQRGKKITNAQADRLIASAQQIRALLNCGN